MPGGTSATFALGKNDFVTGSSGDDAIATGVGNDTIVGFTGHDTVNGGVGTDTMQLLATSSDLSSASDAQLLNVEDVSGASAVTGLTIDLHNQSEGFTVTGSRQADTITGGSGSGHDQRRCWQ